MSKKESSSQGGLLLGLLGIAFVVLKLTKVIDWSWWCVTMPFWGSVAFVSLVFVWIVLLSFFSKRIEDKLKNKGEFNVPKTEKATRPPIKRSLIHKRIEDIRND